MKVIDQLSVLCGLACSFPVVRRAAKVALVVGLILAAINHGDRILGGEVDLATLVKIILTFAVPYGVSTYSSVQALRHGQ